MHVYTDELQTGILQRTKLISGNILPLNFNQNILLIIAMNKIYSIIHNNKVQKN